MLNKAWFGHSPEKAAITNSCSCPSPHLNLFAEGVWVLPFPQILSHMEYGCSRHYCPSGVSDTEDFASSALFCEGKLHLKQCQYEQPTWLGQDSRNKSRHPGPQVKQSLMTSPERASWRNLSKPPPPRWTEIYCLLKLSISFTVPKSTTDTKQECYSKIEVRGDHSTQNPSLTPE